MQAVVQCSVCASRAAGGLLRNQTDLSLLLTNNKALRRGAASIRFSSRKPAVQKLGERRDLEHVSMAPLSVGRGLCAIPFTQTVHTRIVVQRRYLVSLGKLTQAEKDSFLEVINCQRAEASDRLHECKRIESTWIIAVNLCRIAAEAAQTSGAEQASITVRKNIQVAQSQVEEARQLSADADKKLAETKVEEIQRMAEYTAFLGDSEEHEVHEAYLRED
ncbi:Diablo, mitochondrial [Liparis tanakae]|uniref:Diablo, mitochondrial n=1 Tax=Liparis tanakae TaxID=230148 RepID=A0A4Z2EWI4_9TELE|nr:Diablo, mitochondrial [Liparis tanakae]